MHTTGYVEGCKVTYPEGDNDAREAIRVFARFGRVDRPDYTRPANDAEMVASSVLDKVQSPMFQATRMSFRAVQVILLEEMSQVELAATIITFGDDTEPTHTYNEAGQCVPTSVFQELHPDVGLDPSAHMKGITEVPENDEDAVPNPKPWQQHAADRAAEPSELSTAWAAPSKQHRRQSTLLSQRLRANSISAAPVLAAEPVSSYTIAKGSEVFPTSDASQPSDSGDSSGPATPRRSRTMSSMSSIQLSRVLSRDRIPVKEESPGIFGRLFRFKS